DAGDNFIVGNNNAFVVEGDTDYAGFGTATPSCDVDIVKTPASFRNLLCITDGSAASQRSLPLGIAYESSATNLTQGINSGAAWSNDDTTNNNYSSLQFVSKETGGTQYTFGHIANVFTNHATG
ncbi:MAG: hypothetical protein ACXABY_19420, partial [Candidatus Thorarchaeota archaeon]